MLLLTVIQGPDKGRSFRLPPNEPQLIGRSSEALPINDDTVSRRHAELTPDGGSWFIRDLNSQNGTYVNGARIEGRRQLHPGDQIRVGGSVLGFGEDNQIADPLVRLLGSEFVDFDIERSLPSNDDSMILAEPEPMAAAVDHLRVIYQLTTLTTQLLDRDRLLQEVLLLVRTEFKPERGVVVLLNTDGTLGQSLVMPGSDTGKAELGGGGVGSGGGGSAGGNKIGISKTIVRHVVDQSEGVLSTNAMSDRRFSKGDSIQHYGIRSAICSPIRFRERVFGAIYIDSSLANYTYTEQQLALMNAIGQHTGLAMANGESYGEHLQTERLATIGQTVASLSHSIKNILQGLRGGADVVEMGLRKRDLEVSANGWPILKRNLDRIMGLTLNMLAFSRQRSIELELQPLHTVIDDCVSLLEPMATSKKVALIVDYDSEMPPVPLDASLIHQAMMNLITNGIEAVEDRHGAVTIRTMFRETDPLLGQGATYADVQVIDNGPGIAKEHQKRIFEPFYTTKGARGTGLGLAVTKRIVEEHRGRIRVESAGNNTGTIFTMTLPADSTTDPSATANTPTITTDPLRKP